LTSWKNGRNGAIAERVGDVRFHNFRVADNLLAGIEFSLTSEYGNEMAQINYATIVGRSYLNDDNRLIGATPRGIITPRTDNFVVQGARFYNYNWGDAAALGSCSHCFHPAATDSGARTITFRNNTLDATVQRICNYQYPWRAIYYDEDGSITGKGAKSWMTPHFPHHNQSGCEHKPDQGGVYCDQSV
jgi:hypothetical protein